MTLIDWILVVAVFGGVALPLLIKLDHLNPEALGRRRNSGMGWFILLSWVYLSYYIVARWLS